MASANAPVDATSSASLNSLIPLYGELNTGAHAAEQRNAGPKGECPPEDETSSDRKAKRARAKPNEERESVKRQNTKRQRFQWKDEDHREFMAAIFDIGLAHAKPRAILKGMKSASSEITTEHIKSHLQKYRKNMIKTRALFWNQYEIAKRNAKTYADKKALHPHFHTYPMPIGDYPIPDHLKEGLDRFDDEGMKAGGNSDGNGVSDGPRNGSGNENGHEHFPPHLPDPYHQQNGVAQFSGQNNEVYQRMEVQMFLHKQIQQQHELQQTKNQLLYAASKLDNGSANKATVGESSSSSNPPLNGFGENASRNGNTGTGESPMMDFVSPFVTSTALDRPMTPISFGKLEENVGEKEMEDLFSFLT